MSENVDWDLEAGHSVSISSPSTVGLGMLTDIRNSHPQGDVAGLRGGKVPCDYHIFHNCDILKRTLKGPSRLSYPLGPF